MEDDIKIMESSLVDHQNFSLFLNRHEIAGLVQQLGEQITKDYDGKELILVGVLKGAIVFMGDLIRAIDPKKVNVSVDFVRLSSYGRGFTSSGTVTMLKDISVDIKGKHILIVEEIIDSGRTLKFLFDRLENGGAASVEIVSLLDKEAKRVVDVNVKYVGKTTRDQFLIGYGLDLEERCRNLNEIYYLKYPN